MKFINRNTTSSSLSSSSRLLSLRQITLLLATILFIITTKGSSLVRSTGGTTTIVVGVATSINRNSSSSSVSVRSSFVPCGFSPLSSSRCHFWGENQLQGGKFLIANIPTTSKRAYQITTTTSPAAFATKATYSTIVDNRATNRASSLNMVRNNMEGNPSSSWSYDETNNEKEEEKQEEETLHDGMQNNTPQNIHTHYIFLVHGWLGNSSEMGYLQSSIHHQVEECVRNLKDKGGGGISPQLSRIVTHSATSNDAKTTDGISNGGKRLAEEIQQFIQRDIALQLQNNPHHDEKHHGRIFVGISFVGNSLGGLYARYALSLLSPTLHSQPTSSSAEMNVSVPIQLCYEIFATTATPHLGVSRHTFLPLPRTVEQIVGRTLQSTGRDLFRVDPNEDLIYEMSTDYRVFLRPLEKFRKRVAYVNAFRTDFQVPTATAAFLSRNSTFAHRICISRSGGRCEHADDDNDDHMQALPSFIVAVAETDPNRDVLVEDVSRLDANANGNDNGDNGKQFKIHTMSVKLDSLGWKKVFVDVREYIPLPGIALPSFMTRGSRERWNDFLNSLQEIEDRTNDHGKKRMNKMVQSKDLEKFMSSSDRIDVPVGHQVMVANSKNPNYSSFTSKGRPVMDYFAKWLVRNLLNENSSSDKN